MKKIKKLYFVTDNNTTYICGTKNQCKKWIKTQNDYSVIKHIKHISELNSSEIEDIIEKDVCFGIVNMFYNMFKNYIDYNNIDEYNTLMYVYHPFLGYLTHIKTIGDNYITTYDKNIANAMFFTEKTIYMIFKISNTVSWDIKLLERDNMNIPIKNKTYFPSGKYVLVNEYNLFIKNKELEYTPAKIDAFHFKRKEMIKIIKDNNSVYLTYVDINSPEYNIL